MITSSKVIGAGVSYETYSRQLPGVGRGNREFIMSRGELTNFASNPKRWLDGYREDADADTPATKWGSLIECLAGLSVAFDDAYAVAPKEYAVKACKCPSCGTVTDSKSCRVCKCDRVEIEVVKPWNSTATICEKWEAEQDDRDIIKSEVMEKASIAVEALNEDDEVSELFRCSQKQVMVVGLWHDKSTGIEIPLRCLLDLVPDKSHPEFGKCLADFKTARNGSPDIWARVVDDSGYDVQAALSIALYVAATGEDRTDWLHPVQENVAPYHVVSPMPALSTEFIAYGRAKYEAALTAYARCLATGIWPSYPTRDRLVLNSPPCQIVGPDTLYSYRQSAGLPASQRDYEPKPDPTLLDGIPFSPGV